MFKVEHSGSFHYSEREREFAAAKAAAWTAEQADRLYTSEAEIVEVIVNMPESSGTWSVVDAVGTISGTYTLRAIPEPSTLAIFALGLLGLGFMRRRRVA